MDCNKEEATRAKDIAEVKMQCKDFVGAKKLLLKALNLFPDIENASHMLTVCEVHCSAGSLFNGQTDHYGILQVELSADESLIRKQYRRLALLLHPDKNKYAGAEAAFKLVGEAYKVLSDQANRQVYDAKRRVQMRTVSTWQPSQNARNARRYAAATLNVPNKHFGGLKEPDHHHPSSTFFPPQSFWTMCVFCNNRFQYARSWLNREVQCQKCFKKFLAFEVTPQNVPPPGSSSGFSWSRTGFHEATIPAQHPYTHGGHTQASQPSKPVAATNNGYVSGSTVEPKDHCRDGVAGNLNKSGSIQLEKERVGRMTGNAQRVRNRKVVNSSDSGSAGSDSTDSEGVLEVEPTVAHGGPTSSRYPRRSNRHRVNVTYKEDESEDDLVHPRKRLRKMDSFGWKNEDNPSPEVVNNGVKVKNSEAPVSEDGVEEKRTGDSPRKDNLRGGDAQVIGAIPESKDAVSKKDKHAGASSNANSNVGSRSRKPQAGYSLSYPDPELYDFDKDRDQNKFSANQIWAVYDELDGMPRYYALIQKVLASPFRLRFVWLEYYPTSTSEKIWDRAGLPTACGNFKTGVVCTAKNTEMFSHEILGEKLSGGLYNIYPKEGEIWALFKDWDIRWSSARAIPRNYEYEFVEVVSDFAYGKDISVMRLVKVKGFRFVFTRMLDKEITVMPSGQLLKFSHRIPYYKVCEEIEGIPRDSFELDTAALPESLVRTVHTVSDAAAAEVSETFQDDAAAVKDKPAVGTVNSKNSSFGPNFFETDDLLDRSDRAGEIQHVAGEAPCGSENVGGEEAIAPNKQGSAKLGAESNEQHDENPCSNEEEGPNSEFYDFREFRSEDKFEEGQIWALYCDVDAYPKFYVWVKKIDWSASNFMSIKWLELQPTSSKEKLWSRKGLPSGCGRFKVVAGVDQFDSTDSFSHIMPAAPIRKNDWYEIYPNPGEVWAVFKNWDTEWTAEDLRRVADYNVVEIIARDRYSVRAATLTKVRGYNYVFMPETRGAADLDISIFECERFSHQIPAFRLTNQESGKLKDFWELDPYSIPKILLTGGLTH